MSYDTAFKKKCQLKFFMLLISNTYVPIFPIRGTEGITMFEGKPNGRDFRGEIRDENFRWEFEHVRDAGSGKLLCDGLIRSAGTILADRSEIIE